MVTPFQYAAKLLAMRDYPSKVLYDKLVKKEYSKQEAEEAVNRCIELGYLNDQAFAESFIRVQKRKGKGAAVIKQLLRQKGLDVPVPKDDERLIVENLLKTRYKSKDLTDYPTKLKVMQSLVRRGFTLDTVKASILEIDE